MTSPTEGAERLRQIRTFAQLFQYFVDELAWPLDENLLEDEDLEDATFDWEPGELGLQADQVPRLQNLRQLRPLSASQPWGIFFAEFTGYRLPVTQLRRLLQRLVTKKRASGDGSRRSWDLDDLLFVVTTDSGDSVELHLLAFFEQEGSVPEVRSLPWRPVESPDRHLRRLADELLPHLQWPDDDVDPDEWRQEWRDAFKLRHGEVIRSAARLAERMADTAIDLRGQISDALDDERGTGPFSSLLEEVRQELVADVDGPRFADMCAQTLVYGVLSSRVTDPEGFGASPVFSVVPLSSPFLAAFFERVQDQAADIDLEGSGLEQLVADLRATNVEAILDEFGSTAKGGDPVIHFYEEFLQRYDRKMRADAGAFYTPQPVVEFMVRTVDELLRTRFGLELGVADPSTWGEVAERQGFTVPDGIDPDKPFISMLDPATGTGTFLVEWLRRAESSFHEARPDGDWPAHLREHVLPSMHAFELMLGPYAIAHLKVALELHTQGVEDGAMAIYLTDTLDHAARALQLETMRDPIAVEGEIAADLKEHERFSVVIGNPPYDREQRAVGDGGKRKGGVVRFGVPGIEPLLDDVIGPMRDAGLGVHVKNLYNDYVYFWRWAAWQATELPDGPGVVAFITASSYLDGVSMGGLRALLRRDFDEIWIVDLGGEGRAALVEENVFDILTPVSIAFAVRFRPSRMQECEVTYLRIAGSRRTKFDSLEALDLRATSDATSVTCERQLDPMTPRSASPYYQSPMITQLLPSIRPGCKFHRTWTIGPTNEVLADRWRDLIESKPADRAGLLKETRDRKVTSAPRPLMNPSLGRLTALHDARHGGSDARPEAILRYGYRSFDRQYAIADSRVADFPAPSLWESRSGSQVYFVTLTSAKLGAGPALTVSVDVPDHDFFRGSYGAKNVMALYLDHRAQRPNVTAGLLEALGAASSRPVMAEDLAAYIFGLLGTGAFTERFADELAEGAGPVRVPITSDPTLFGRAVVIGRDLLWWHTWGERFAPGGGGGLPAGSACETVPVRSYPERFRYEPATEELIVGDGVFGPVSEEVWNFEVSGLKVISSWLGYRMAVRKGKKSSPLDDIRPSRWTFSDELLRLLAILEHTVEVTPAAAALLEEIVAGPLIDAADLPTPNASHRGIDESAQ